MGAQVRRLRPCVNRMSHANWEESQALNRRLRERALNDGHPPPDPKQAAATSIENLPIDPSTPLFRVRSFSLLFITRVASTTAFQMLSVVVGWHVYELTDSALQLGLIGLAQFMAPILFMVPAGQIVDRYNRRFVLRCAYAVAFLSSAGLMLVAAMPAPSLVAIYVLIFVNMAARTFEQPLMQALLPAMVPRADPQPRDRGARLRPPSVGADRAVARRRALHLRAGVRLWRLHRAGAGRRRRHAVDARSGLAQGAADGQPRDAARRLPLHVALRNDPGRHAVRVRRRAVRQRERAVPDLCPRHPRDRSLGRRRAAQRARARRVDRRRLPGPLSDPARRRYLALCRLRAHRRSNDRVRPLDQPRSLDRGPDGGRASATW